MTNNMKFLTNINDEKYTEFIKNHKHGNMMQAIEWSHIKNTWGAVRVAVADENDNIVAETKIIKRGKQFVNAECEIWNADKTRLIARGTSNLFKISN